MLHLEREPYEFAVPLGGRCELGRESRAACAPARPSVERSRWRCRRRGSRYRALQVESGDGATGLSRIFAFDGLVPTEPASAILSTSSSTGSKRPPSMARSAPRCCNCRNRTTPDTADVAVGCNQAPERKGCRSHRCRRRQRPRPQHPELPARLVLSRVGPIRVQQVALVQHRAVGDGAGLVPVAVIGVSLVARRPAQPASVIAIVERQQGPAATGTPQARRWCSLIVAGSPTGVGVVLLESGRA